jgi:hypothetical protein
MARRHDELGMFAGQDVRAEQMCCGGVLFGAEFE